MITGDFNARIGKESHETNPRTVGPACYYESTNNNGQRMIDLCEATDLRIAHSHFLNRKARLYTYVGPKGDQQQLDHVSDLGIEFLHLKIPRQPKADVHDE